jgi:hypothetical protein
MRRSEFVDLVAIVDKLMVNLTDFNVSMEGRGRNHIERHTPSTGTSALDSNFRSGLHSDLCGAEDVLVEEAIRSL